MIRYKWQILWLFLFSDLDRISIKKSEQIEMHSIGFASSIRLIHKQIDNEYQLNRLRHEIHLHSTRIASGSVNRKFRIKFLKQTVFIKKNFSWKIDFLTVWCITDASLTKKKCFVPREVKWFIWFVYVFGFVEVISSRWHSMIIQNWH